MKKRLISFMLLITVISCVGFNTDYFKNLLTLISQAAKEVIYEETESYDEETTDSAVDSLEQELEKLDVRNLFEKECETESGSGSNKIDYKKVFFEQNPELEGKVVVHHSIEQQVLKRYPGLFTAEEINAYDMLRGIPKDINSKVHLSDIRIEWNNFYKKVDAGEIALTKENFLNKALEIDKLFGSQFQPPR